MDRHGAVIDVSAWADESTSQRALAQRSSRLLGGAEHTGTGAKCSTACYRGLRRSGNDDSLPITPWRTYAPSPASTTVNVAPVPGPSLRTAISPPICFR